MAGLSVANAKLQTFVFGNLIMNLLLQNSSDAVGTNVKCCEGWVQFERITQWEFLGETDSPEHTTTQMCTQPARVGHTTRPSCLSPCTANVKMQDTKEAPWTGQAASELRVPTHGRSGMIISWFFKIWHWFFLIFQDLALIWWTTWGGCAHNMHCCLSTL